MSKPGQADPSMAATNASTAEATPLQDVPPSPGPTGPASRDGAVTAPPANLDGASPAATAPEASFQSTMSSVSRERELLRVLREMGIDPMPVLKRALAARKRELARGAR